MTHPFCRKQIDKYILQKGWDYIMESVIIDWLNGYSIRIGTIVIVIATFIILFSIIYRGRKKYDLFLNELVKKRIKKEKEENESKKNIEEMTAKINSISDSISKLSDSVNKLSEKITESDISVKQMEKNIDMIQDEIKKNTVNIDVLLDSDRENIRSDILRQYYRCVEKQQIDLYTLNVLEYKFKKYKEVEHGNSFVKRMMDELRSLPKVINYSHMNDDDTDPIGYFADHPEVLEEMGITINENSIEQK